MNSDFLPSFLLYAAFSNSSLQKAFSSKTLPIHSRPLSQTRQKPKNEPQSLIQTRSEPRNALAA